MKRKKKKSAKNRYKFKLSKYFEKKCNPKVKMRDFFVLHSHSKNESFASRPAAVAAREDWLFEFLDRDQTVDRNEGIEKSKLMPLSTEVRFIKRCVNRPVIVGKFDENDEIGELFSYLGNKSDTISIF